MRTQDRDEVHQPLGAPIRREPAKPELRKTERDGVLIDAHGRRQTDIPLPPLEFFP